MKKGFTLIELLAVLVILAIIALIATPIIVKIVNNSWDESYKRTAEGYSDAVNNAIARQKLSDTNYNIANGNYSLSATTRNLCLNADCSKELEVQIDKETIKSGEIYIYNGVVKDYYLVIDETEVYKDTPTDSSCFTYTTNNDGTLTLSSYTCANKITDIVIPRYIDGKKVTIMGSGLFYNTSVSSLKIPSSVTYISGGFIGPNATLTKLTVPGSVKTIDGGAINAPIEELILEEGIETISSGAIYGALKVKSLTIPGSVKIINPGNFNVSLIETLTLKDGIQEIGMGVFSGAVKIKKLIIPSSLKKIGSGAFSGVPIETLILKEGIEQIDMSAFNGNKLTTLTIPSSVTTLGDNAFKSETLTNVVILGKTATNQFASYGAEVFGNATITFR